MTFADQHDGRFRRGGFERGRGGRGGRGEFRGGRGTRGAFRGEGRGRGGFSRGGGGANSQAHHTLPPAINNDQEFPSLR